MSTVITYDRDPRAERISVYYEGTDTIYEGMPVCYNYNTTTNWLGVSDFETESSTTAEGSQNEGKFIRVEDVGNDGIMCFAGVVANGSPGIGSVGPGRIDIYVPNGAIVPVRSGISTTRAQTVFGIMSGSDAFETSIYGTRSANCAIAMETVDRSSTEGLCLAQLYHPLDFNKGSQDHDYEAFKVGVGTSSGDINCQKEIWEIWSTGGTFKTRWWETYIAADGSACPYGGVISATLRMFAACDAPGDNLVNTYINTQWDSGATVPSGVNVKNLYLRLFDDGATMTSADYICNLYLENNIDSSSGSNYQIYSYVHGSDGLDAFIYAPNNKSLGAEAATGDTAHDSSDIVIPINVGGSTYYIVAQDSKG